MLWFVIVAVGVAYISYLVIGGVVNAQASSAPPVVVRDEVGVNAHHLSGMVMVPTPCDQLSVSTETLSPTTYSLLFKTWREPSVQCAEEPTPRAFRTVLFAAAANTYFVATLDGAALPIAVIPVVAGRGQ